MPPNILFRPVMEVHKAIEYEQQRTLLTEAQIEASRKEGHSYCKAMTRKLPRELRDQIYMAYLTTVPKALPRYFNHRMHSFMAGLDTSRLTTPIAHELTEMVFQTLEFEVNVTNILEFLTNRVYDVVPAAHVRTLDVVVPSAYLYEDEGVQKSQVNHLKNLELIEKKKGMRLGICIKGDAYAVESDMSYFLDVLLPVARMMSAEGAIVEGQVPGSTRRILEL
ncbi:hypothetical protein K504DRAFT_498685 [Pleomassaria siparia CBS 279.74]|uniref:Uncharacterized protein n=1 Tax=Pleomassaria siparia CBS 279.74 TaxID=1314801 RepID=A0A6G1KM18_9PLEO|nr:hypothetical protein K504DRAFT_498685 [Pleomassaria siparia CBS 279.74]